MKEKLAYFDNQAVWGAYDNDQPPQPLTGHGAALVEFLNKEKTKTEGLCGIG